MADADDEEVLPQRFAAASPDGSDADEDDKASPGLLRPLDHDGFDPYISRFKAKVSCCH